MQQQPFITLFESNSRPHDNTSNIYLTEGGQELLAKKPASEPKPEEDVQWTEEGHAGMMEPTLQQGTLFSRDDHKANVGRRHAWPLASGAKAPYGKL